MPAREFLHQKRPCCWRPTPTTAKENGSPLKITPKNATLLTCAASHQGRSQLYENIVQLKIEERQIAGATYRVTVRKNRTVDRAGMTG